MSKRGIGTWKGAVSKRLVLEGRQCLKDWHGKGAVSKRVELEGAVSKILVLGRRQCLREWHGKGLCLNCGSKSKKSKK